MNLSYIDWYLVELRREVHGQIATERESSLMEETRIHLSSLVEDLLSDGIDQETAEKAAIERFGEPRTIAKHYLTMNQTASTKSQAVIEGSIFCLVTLGLFALLGEFRNIRPEGFVYLTGISALLFWSFSRFTGRLPRAKFILAPMICISILGFPAAGLTSFYLASSGGLSVHLKKELESSLQEAVVRDTAATVIEDKVDAVWKQLLNDSKVATGIPAGSSIEVPGYRAMGASGVYIQMDMKPGETTRYADGSEKVVLENSEVHLELLKPRIPDTWRGPMTRAEFEMKLRREIAVNGWQRKYRAQAVGILQGAVDRPYVARYGLFTVPFLVIYGLGLVPIGLLFSLFGRTVYRYFRFRNRLKLA